MTEPKKYKVVGASDTWADVVEYGFTSYEDAMAEIKRIESGWSSFDLETFKKDNGSMWVEEDDGNDY